MDKSVAAGNAFRSTKLRAVADTGDRLYSIEEAIDYLALGGRPNPEGALRWLMRTRGLGYVKLARGIYGFRRQDLDEFISKQRVHPRR